jgi:UDP-N-acetylmuramate--alanine ligase
MELTPNLPQRIHFLGLGGAGVSGAARLLAARGRTVSGHDRTHSPFLDGLGALGITVDVSASCEEALPADAEVVVRSAAVPDADPQVRAARARGLPVLKYAQILGQLAAAGRTLGVAGTHGKTTTTWLLERALVGAAGESGARGASRPGALDGAHAAARPGALDGAHAAARPGALDGAHAAARPGALVGGTDLVYRSNARVPDADGWFALEACEYDRSFLCIDPFGAIVTNVEADHLDCYGDLAGVITGFARFAQSVHPDGLLVVGDDVPAAVEHAARCAVWRLGRELVFEHGLDAHGNARFALRGPGFALRAQLAIPGRVAAIDAALAAALALGVLPLEARAAAAPRVAASLATFKGTARRFETWGREGEIVVVHDYAHHPTELAATLESARGAYRDRPIHVLFQPHQHSRTAHFLAEFAAVLATADRAVVTDVYGARVHIDGEHFAGAAELAAAARGCGGDVEHIANLSESARRFAKQLPPRALALVLGAGDVENVKDELLRHLPVRVHATSAAR